MVSKRAFCWCPSFTVAFLFPVTPVLDHQNPRRSVPCVPAMDPGLEKQVRGPPEQVGKSSSCSCLGYLLKESRLTLMHALFLHASSMHAGQEVSCHKGIQKKETDEGQGPKGSTCSPGTQVNSFHMNNILHVQKPVITLAAAAMDVTPAGCFVGVSLIAESFAFFLLQMQCSLPRVKPFQFSPFDRTAQGGMRPISPAACTKLTSQLHVCTLSMFHSLFTTIAPQDNLRDAQIGGDDDC